jgi:hypothetical protein
MQWLQPSDFWNYAFALAIFAALIAVCRLAG